MRRLFFYALNGISKNLCTNEIKSGIIESTSYEYDGLKRLTKESVKVGNNTTDTYTYEYDDYGNRSKMTATGTEEYVTEYSYNNAQGKYTALLQKETKTIKNDGKNPLDKNDKVEQTVYTYDKNGNQVKKVADGKTETNTYDGLNQLIGFTDGETTASYAYNVDGLRYEKTVDGQTINHVWDGGKQIVADVIDNQFYEADCYIRGTNLVAKYNYKNGDKSEYTYYTQNAHGDVVNLTDKDGKVTKKYTYDAFGVEKNIDKNDANAFRYCGEYYDKETATVYLRARYYDPEIGRFISRDSYTGEVNDPLSLNLYTYCHNNPILGIDPSGHFFSELWDGVKSAASAVTGAVKDFASSTVGKVVIGTVATVAAVGITVATGGAAAPVLVGVASSTIMGAGISAVEHRIQTGSWKGAGTAALRGAADGYMWGGIGAFAGSSISAIKAVGTAKRGITIGENMEKVRRAASLNDTAVYKAMKGYNPIKKVFGENVANKLSIAHNKRFIKRMTKLGSVIYDNGPVNKEIASKWYSMERTVVKGYKNYVKMF